MQSEPLIGNKSLHAHYISELERKRQAGEWHKLGWHSRLARWLSSKGLDSPKFLSSVRGIARWLLGCQALCILQPSMGRNDGLTKLRRIGRLSRLGFQVLLMPEMPLENTEECQMWTPQHLIQQGPSTNRQKEAVADGRRNSACRDTFAEAQLDDFAGLGLA